ncbi:MAG: hypothetical protein QOI80_3033, partial [Solirubrobacteraceae bacterium]|nr:hypothetical protein [Solirubrobacteraceae bacterium]
SAAMAANSSSVRVPDGSIGGLEVGSNRNLAERRAGW